ncbi:uncharacterized protein LOC134282256 [Saccostrea cucullata]|uniref:uncharacterized protein LOC134282256 n=1 Tax=Saccostrea cuccullata TaxID=36930 RepID=UPI002ED56A33
MESEEEEEKLSHLLGDYSVWKTNISEKFDTLSAEELCMLVCFLCADSGSPDFAEPTWLEILNKIKSKLNEEDPLSKKEALKTLDKLKSSEFLLNDENGVRITEDAADEIMYVFVEYAFARSDFNVYYLSFETTRKYTRAQGYKRKPGEKCAICLSPEVESLILYRLQTDFLIHVTMEDTGIYNKVFQILNIPVSILQKPFNERERFLKDLQENGETVPRGESKKSAKPVKWHPRFWRHDLTRSNIGLHPHLDLFIINNIAYRKPSCYHKYPADVRSLLYSLLFMKKYTVQNIDESFKLLSKKVRKKYFTKITSHGNINMSILPKDLTRTQAGFTTFASDAIRHDIMYAFVTECLLGDSDLEFFLSEASCDVISEYCRSWGYERSDGERCLYVPYRPESMMNVFIDKLQMNIISHCTVSDENVFDSICEQLKVPVEVLHWNEQARKRYVEYTKKGTWAVHQARGMIVGCAGAGKTTLLRRLLRCSEEEIMNTETTEEIEVHEEIFEICQETKSLKATCLRNEYGGEERPSKTLTFFDFGGQCVYYACHQIYLTRRAFYIVAVDASKNLDEEVDDKLCDQTRSLFSKWTYGDYFVFWIKSIHTYCGTEKEKTYRPIILIVATHWENKIYKSKECFVERLQGKIPENSFLLQYVKIECCFFTQFPPTPLEALEKRISEISLQDHWKKNIPKDWALFDIEISERKSRTKILDLSNIVTLTREKAEEKGNTEENEKKDMLRYYHDVGKVLHFNEDGLENLVIIDVQWFVNIFKGIITDKNHLDGIATRLDWNNYYYTGHMTKDILRELIKTKDEKERKEACKNDNSVAPHSVSKKPFSRKSEKSVYFQRDESQSTEEKSVNQSLPYHLDNFDIIFKFMERLGLIASEGKDLYIPCMNRKTFDKNILNKIVESKTSILVFQFKYLPYFLYFRLVVACLGAEGWKVLKNGNSCLYKNVALFSYKDHKIAIAVTETSIQLQIYFPNDSFNSSSDVVISCDIQEIVEKLLEKITSNYHKRVEYVRGFSCRDEKEQCLTMDMEGHFIPEKDIKIGNQVSCPLHQVESHHFVNTKELTRYWICGTV